MDCSQPVSGKTPTTLVFSRTTPTFAARFIQAHGPEPQEEQRDERQERDPEVEGGRGHSRKCVVLAKDDQTSDKAMAKIILAAIVVAALMSSRLRWAAQFFKR